MKTKLFVLVFVLVLLVCAFASCGGGHTHSYTSKVTAPTCTTDGFTTYTCECGDTYTSDVVPAGHTWGSEIVIYPTCQAGGRTTKTCAVCGTVDVTDETPIDPTKHVYSTDWSHDNDYHWHEALCGCNDAGESEKGAHTIIGGTCTVCGAGVCNHPNKEVLESLAATCVADGYMIIRCPDCEANGRVYETLIVEEKLGHDYNDGVVTDPTCTEDGYTTVTCKRESCTAETEGHSIKTDMVARLGHEFGEDGVCERCEMEANVKVTYVDLGAEGTEEEMKNTNPLFFADQGTYSLKQPTRRGNKDFTYKFVGWYLDEACTEACVTIDTSVAQNITLYAKWEAVSTSDHEHTYEEAWSFDENEHWHESSCEHRGLTIDVEAHSYDNDSYCVVCGRRDPNWEKKYTITWGDTEIIIQMNQDSNKQELPASCKRYLAGENGDNQFIDTMIKDRNDRATNATKVSAKYAYLEDGQGYGWGANIDHIYNSVGSSATDKPDVYVNFVYDMLAASLKGCFANLYTTQMGANEFQFAQDRNFKDTGTGYMLEYMKSMTLSNSQMYLLSSDYFIDMVRAFLVVPVNISMLGNIAVDPDPYSDNFNSDRDGDGDFDIEDFYTLIWYNKWNYETLAAFSSAIFTKGESVAGGDPMGTLKDTLVFALGTRSGLPASGMLYTTTVEIIHREWSDATNNWEFYYPDTNDDLLVFCSNLTALFSDTNNQGIVAVDDDEVYGYGNGALQAIRVRFAENKILFGGVICLGSLEYDEYEKMDEGFGIIPVPLYRTGDENGRADDYQTQIHNVGRIGAISRTTKKFTQCSAYLDYQSTHSTEILDEYYETSLTVGIAGGAEYNVEMLQYIRKNVRSSFDKAFEDAIGVHFANDGESSAGGDSLDSSKQKWHALIIEHDFKLGADRMKVYYDALIGLKKERLDTLKNTYLSLPK